MDKRLVVSAVLMGAGLAAFAISVNKEGDTASERAMLDLLATASGGSVGLALSLLLWRANCA